MKLEFKVFESKSFPLLDYVWFDLTRFEVSGSPDDRRSARTVLEELIRAPIFQRSLCTSPDPWGAGKGLHGPFEVEKLSVGCFQPVAPRELKGRIDGIWQESDFDRPPPSWQLEPVEGWAKEVLDRNEEVFILDPASSVDAKVDWAFVWILFWEAISLSRDHTEATVAIIGLD